MKFGAFFFGTVDMPDAGLAGPPAEHRNYGQADYVNLYKNLLAYAQRAEVLGFDSMWTAEHHFHNHGFEVVPNVLLLNAVLAQHTKSIRFGSLVHVLTQWHPIRFAEDYALADVLSGGRMLCGLGRGSEQRESAPFGVNYGWAQHPDNILNREIFEEQVAIFKAATTQEQFSFRGKHYVIPPDGLEFRGEPVTTLPLVPKPVNVPVPIYQAVASEDTLDYAARERHTGVFWTKQTGPDTAWKRYGRLVEQHHGVRLRDGEDRMLVLNLHMADTFERALEEARPGHDELMKLLWPNELRKHPELGPRKMPALEETMSRGSWLVGTPEQVRDQLLAYHDELKLEYLTIFPQLPGLTGSDTLAQLDMFSSRVMPALSAELEQAA